MMATSIGLKKHRIAPASIARSTSVVADGQLDQLAAFVDLSRGTREHSATPPQVTISYDPLNATVAHLENGMFPEYMNDVRVRGAQVAQEHGRGAQVAQERRREALRGVLRAV